MSSLFVIGGMLLPLGEVRKQYEQESGNLDRFDISFV